MIMENPTIYLVKISADKWLGAEGPVDNQDIAPKFDSEADGIRFPCSYIACPGYSIFHAF
jgi:hypothetical protein